MNKQSNLSKWLLSVMAVIMICIGWYAEVLFYFYRLNGDGLDIIPSIAIGSGLTLVLTYFFIDTNWLKRIGIFILLCTSIFFTVAGQNYFYTQKHNTDSKQTANEENKQLLFNEYTANIEKLKTDIVIKESIVPTDLIKLAQWKTNAVNPLREDIAILKTEKKEYETLRSAIILTNSASVKIENLTAYEALAKDLGLSSFTPLKLISQALLSLFIALMAPSGIRLLNSIWGIDKQKDIKKPKEDNKKANNVTDFITIFAMGRYGEDDKPAILRGRQEVVEGSILSYGQFNKINKYALDLGLITSTGSITTPNVSLSDFIDMMNKKQSYSSSMKAVR